MTAPTNPPTLVDLAARVRAGRTAPYSDLAAAVVQAEERLRALAEEWAKGKCDGYGAAHFYDAPCDRCERDLGLEECASEIRAMLGEAAR